MDLFNEPENRLVEAEYWFAIEEVLAREHLEAGREIDRHIAKLQQMQRENAESSKHPRESMHGSVPAKRDRIRTMDLERAMEFMLEQQAQMQTQQAKFQDQQVKFDERHAKLQEQQATFQENLVAHDERLAKAERLLIRGAETLASHREAIQETDRRITALVLSQEELRASLKAFIDSIRKSGNGH